MACFLGLAYDASYIKHATCRVNTPSIIQSTLSITYETIGMIAITAAQVRAARAMVKWTQQDLARASGVSLPTIKRMEAGDGPIRGITDNVWKVQRALEAAGVEFINDDAPGIRLRRPQLGSR